MIGHDEVQELLGAYALDAVDGEEKTFVEYHLERCPRCRDELRSYREVVGLIANAGQEAPPGLWDRLLEGIGEPAAGRPLPDIPSIGGRRPSRLERLWRPVLAGVAAVLILAVALLGVQVGRLQNRTDHLNRQVAVVVNGLQPSVSVVSQALTEPGAHRVQLRPAGGGPAQLDAVILPGGSGYLYGSRLAPLPSSQTYQLWGITGPQAISYGLIGSVPAQVTAFRAGHSVEVLAVTVEEAGGVPAPTQTPIVEGTVG
jgi:Anti-sigma-K factor rskA/Putative zinc-finger